MRSSPVVDQPPPGQWESHRQTWWHGYRVYQMMIMIIVVWWNNINVIAIRCYEDLWGNDLRLRTMLSSKMNISDWACNPCYERCPGGSPIPKNPWALCHRSMVAIHTTAKYWSVLPHQTPAPQGPVAMRPLQIHHTGVPLWSSSNNIFRNDTSMSHL